MVDVAVPVKSIPFWIADQGFQATNLTLENCDTSWTVYRKTFEPGWIGLGVNGLDRTPVGSLRRFCQAADGTDRPTTASTLVKLDATQSPSWKTAAARPGVSAAHDAHKPFEALPVDLVDAVLIQPAHAERHSTLLATGRVWKTHVVSSSVPDQVTIAFGSDPARELVWTWRTSADIASTAIRVARLPKGAERRASDRRCRHDGTTVPGRDGRVDAGRSPQLAQ